MTAAVVFDFYGTLAEAEAWGPWFEEILAARGFNATVERGALLALDGTLHTEHSSSRDAYVEWERRLLAERCAAWGVPTAVADVVDELHAASKTATLRLYPEVPAVLSALADRGVRLAICSNWDWDLPDRVDELGVAGAFDVVVTSARAGARKAHPHIYRHTLDLLGTDPGATLFVGDTWDPDVAGPLQAGMPAVHLHRDGDPRPAPPPPPGSTRLADLTGLLDLLDHPAG